MPWAWSNGNGPAPAQPGQLLAGEDLTGRLLLGLSIDPLGAGVEVGRVGARTGGGLVDEAPPAVEFDDLARPDGGGQPVEGVTVVRDEHQRRLHLHEARLEPLDRLEIEVVRRFVEHHHVVVAVLVVGEHPGQCNPLRLATGEFVGTTIEQGLDTELRRDSGHLPRVAEKLAHRAGGSTGSCSSDAIRTDSTRSAPRPRRAQHTVMIFSSVVLPEPLTPTTATRSPVETVTATSSNSTLSG